MTSEDDNRRRAESDLAGADGRAWRAAATTPWAITAEGLELVLAVAARDSDVSIEALEAYRAQHVQQSERLDRRGNVAIITAVGPLFSKANLFTAISGATSYDVMRRDLQVALDDPEISAVVLNLDSPGGTVTGANELADAILAARERKRIVAYVGGVACSAAYWLAASASEIVVDATATLGSIGVRAVITDTSRTDAERGRVEFVSSQSPGKRMDLATDEGRARIQRQVDALAEVFIKSVARARGVKVETVVERFGAGDVLVGTAAVAAGLADRLGSFESVVSELRGAKPKTAEPGPRSALDERARIAAILALPEAEGREAAARHLALCGDITVADAKVLLADVPLPRAGLASLGLRTADAPGGLILTDPVTGEHRLAEAGELAGLALPVVPQTPGQRTRSMWRATVAEINGAPAAPTPPAAEMPALPAREKPAAQAAAEEAFRATVATLSGGK